MTGSLAIAALCALAALPLAAATPGTTVREWRFEVTIDGIGVGEHRYLVTADGPTLAVRSEAAFRVRVLMLDAYRREQHVDETYYWNPAVLQRTELINAQTGVPTPVHVERIGPDTIDARGRSTPATHWRLDTPRNRIELWYSRDGEWLAMRTTTREGHVLDYRLV